MNAALKKLIELAPPVSDHQLYSEEDWVKVEQILGVTLPDDYKEYIGYYGASYVCSFLRVSSPFATKDVLNLNYIAADSANTLREMRYEFGENESPFPIYPETNGLLAWGETDNGDVVFWLTVGKPNEWTVVVNGSRSSIFEEHSYSMVEFVLRLFSGTLSSDILPKIWHGDRTIEGY